MKLKTILALFLFCSMSSAHALTREEALNSGAKIISATITFSDTGLPIANTSFERVGKLKITFRTPDLVEFSSISEVDTRLLCEKGKSVSEGLSIPSFSVEGLVGTPIAETSSIKISGTYKGSNDDPWYTQSSKLAFHTPEGLTLQAHTQREIYYRDFTRAIETVNNDLDGCTLVLKVAH